jgi:hypothetical protein
MDTSFLYPISDIKIINIKMTSMFPELLFPFSSNCIELTLSRKTKFGSTFHPCSFIKRLTHKIFEITSSNDTNSASVELRVSFFCFVDVEEIEPQPRDIHAPVWLFLS